MTTPSSDSPNSAAATTDAALADTLLMCVDMQPVFVRAVAEGTSIQKRCAFALAAARGLGMPIIFTEQVPDKLGATDPALRALAPDAPVYPKRTFSVLADAATRDAILADGKVQHLLLCGIETSVCVYQTALAAREHGLEVTILSDAVSARRPDDARACLEALARAGVHVLPSETIFYAVLHDVKHPFFKAYTQLVKAAS
ncbi:isochorismatase family protein [Opitutus sp. ER46]|uniref:isochorismatase family protein n=1 Tax=Opitutus sp. ER46 TaxID=2161864 RepID=UPI000D300209|nr:isochorismatase family protein [Opitutus sp. ER46]PTX94328.1 isochorismatase [Opitutus sp. ER46]